MVALALLMVACAEERIHDDARTFERQGQYAQAVGVLEQGLADHPDSLLLRSQVIATRTDALTHQLAQAAAARAAGRLDEAKTLAEQARAFDPGEQRVNALLADIDTERRQHAAAQAARALLAKGLPGQARRVVAEALKDNPKQDELLTLQRQLEVTDRDARLRHGRATLADKRPISLDFRDAGLRTVLDVVSRNSGINFVLDKDIRADVKVTVFLRSAPVEEAIDLIVGTNQLAKKVIDEKTILIYPNTPEKQHENQEQVVRVFYLSNAEAKSASAFLKSMLKIKDPFVDERANMIALRESPENIEMAERLLALYDVAEPEVLLDLEVLEVSTNRLTELGLHLPDTIGFSLLPPLAAAVSTGTSTATAGGITLGNIASLGRNNVGVTVPDVQLLLKRTVGDVKTLSSPRIRVKSHEKAHVLVGDKIPVITVTTGTGTFVSDSVNYIDVGLKLDVEPVISVDDEVTMKVALEVSTLGDQVKTASGSLAYQIGTRNATTVLRLEDGQTQMLGGLISRDERSSASRVPGIGDLPVLGRLFSDQTDSSSRTELILAITPHVVRSMHKPDVSQAEMWVGTDALPRLREVGGRTRVDDEVAPGGQAASAGVPVVRSPAGPTSGDGAPSAVVAAGGGTSSLPSVAQAGDDKPPAVAAVPSTLQWTLEPAAVKTGDIVAATLMLQAGAPLHGVSFQIAYPKDRVAFQSIEEGALFRQRSGTTSFTHSVTDGDTAGEGRIKGGVLRSDGGDASGQGSLVKIWFKTLKPGPVEVRAVSLEPIGEQSAAARAPVPVSTTIEVAP